MYLAKVVGQLTATIKNPNFKGHKLLLVEKTDKKGNLTGDPEIAVDLIGVGDGEFVMVEGGKEAALALPNHYGPSDASILARVENVNYLQGEKP